MGGFIAQMLAELYPERVQNLALLCTTGLGAEFIEIPILSREALIEFYKLDREESIKKAVSLTTYKKTNLEIIEHILKVRLEHVEDIDQVLLQRDAIENFFAKEKIDYSKINCKTLIMTGENDRFVDPRNSKVLMSKFINSHFVNIPESDHFFFMEKVDEVSQHLNNFLKDL